MIWTAVLVACLVSAPTDCRTHEMLIEGSPIPYAVNVEAQVRAAQWIAEHDGLVMKSLEIRPGREV